MLTVDVQVCSNVVLRMTSIKLYIKKNRTDYVDDSSILYTRFADTLGKKERKVFWPFPIGRVTEHVYIYRNVVLVG